MFWKMPFSVLAITEEVVIIFLSLQFRKLGFGWNNVLSKVPRTGRFWATLQDRLSLESTFFLYTLNYCSWHQNLLVDSPSKYSERKSRMLV